MGSNRHATSFDELGRVSGAGVVQIWRLRAAPPRRTARPAARPHGKRKRSGQPTRNESNEGARGAGLKGGGSEARCVLCLSHDGGVAWDLRWSPVRQAGGRRARHPRSRARRRPRRGVDRGRPETGSDGSDGSTGMDDSPPARPNPGGSFAGRCRGSAASPSRWTGPTAVARSPPRAAAGRCACGTCAPETANARRDFVSEFCDRRRRAPAAAVRRVGAAGRGWTTKGAARARRWMGALMDGRPDRVTAWRRPRCTRSTIRSNP